MIIPAGQTPEDNIHLDALTLANLAGQSKSYTWAQRTASDLAKPARPRPIRGPGRPDDPMDQSTIAVEAVLDRQHRPGERLGDQLGALDVVLRVVEPLACVADAFERQASPDVGPTQPQFAVAHRLADRGQGRPAPDPAADDRPDARRRRQPGACGPRLGSLAARSSAGRRFGSLRSGAKSFRRRQAQPGRPVRIEILADEAHPVVNPAVVAANWSGRAHQRRTAAPLSGARLGYVDKLEGRTLVAYLPLEAKARLTITPTPEP